MTEYVVDTRTPVSIIIGATGITEILQNVRTILDTIKGTVPFDREFGLNITFLDRPLPAAMAEFRGESISAIERLEPRVSVTSVDFVAKPDEAMDGKLYPVVSVNIKDGAI